MAESTSLPGSDEHLSIYTTSQLISVSIQKVWGNCSVLKCVKNVLERQKVDDQEVSPDEVRELQKLESSVIERKSLVEKKYKQFGVPLFIPRLILFTVALLMISISLCATTSYLLFKKKPLWAPEFLSYWTPNALLYYMLYLTFDFSVFKLIWLYSYIQKRNEKFEEKEEEKKPIVTTSSELVQRQIELLQVILDMLPMRRQVNISITVQFGLDVFFPIMLIMFGSSWYTFPTN